MVNFEQLRALMVKTQLQSRGITDPAVLAAMGEVPREHFVLSSFRDSAYDDAALPIEEDQTISQPYVVALMAQALHLQSDDVVFEVGTGSGYAAAVLSRMARHVYTIEYYSSLAARARNCYRTLGYNNISVFTGDGSLGLPEYAPYNAISVTAGGKVIPEKLLAQLAKGGRLVMPVGSYRYDQDLILVTKDARGHWTSENLGAVRFVPLL